MTEEIEEQIRDAEVAPESSVRLDETEPLTEMSPVKMQSAGYVYIYNTRTAERSICNRNMLAAHLRKTRPDKSLVFTTRKPSFSPRRGTLKCMLHPDDLNRAHYDELGLATCRKSNLTSPYQVRRHMEKRHKAEWATIKEEITNKEKEEAREERRQEHQLRESIINMGKKEEPPLYVKEKK